MIEHVWSHDPLPEDLGVVVHGPALLGRANGVAVGGMAFRSEPR